MKKAEKDAKAAKRASLILLCVACVILGFVIIHQILRGGTFDSTKIGGIVIGAICILFAIFYHKLYIKKKNEENQSYN
jgi:TRAP-type C4-dicarboxylate transport system permease large subunit